MPHMFGDLLLTSEQEKALIINSDEEELAQGYLETAKKWPGGVIPYTIEYSLSEFEKK